MKILYNIAKGFTIMRQVQRNGFVHVQWGTMFYWHGHACKHIAIKNFPIYRLLAEKSIRIQS